MRTSVPILLSLLGASGLSQGALRRLVAGRIAAGADWLEARAAAVAAGAKPADGAWVEAETALLIRHHVEVLVLGSAAYPLRLAAIPDPPLALFVAGHPDVLDAFGVAVVGSRRCSPAAEALARVVARDLATAGVVIVSGLAVGVDAAAHRGALDARGRTVAVLGGGHGRIYPWQNRGLAAAIAEGGAVVSEYTPGTPPHKRRFPERNRIVSGLTAGVVLIEAGERSGSLITARLALEQGREVMAVPGQPQAGRSRGCHRLIQSGAALVEDATDVLRVLGLNVPPPDGARVDAEPAVQPLLEALTAEHAVTADALVEATGWPVSRVLEGLVALELGGLVTAVDGGYIRRPR